MKRFGLYITVVLALFLFSCTQEQTDEDIFTDLPTPPALTGESGDIVGQAFYPHEAGYASPFNVFVDDPQKARVFSITPTAADIALEENEATFNIILKGHPDSGYAHAVLDPVLYYDYSRGTNGEWVAIPLTGDPVGTSFQHSGFTMRWLRHSGTATAKIRTSSLPDGLLYFAAFSCWKKVRGDPWRCGPQTVTDAVDHWMLETSFIRYVGFPPEPPPVNDLTKRTVTLTPTNLIVKPTANLELSAYLEGVTRVAVPNSLRVVVKDAQGNTVTITNNNGAQGSEVELGAKAYDPQQQCNTQGTCTFVQSYTASIKAPQQTGMYTFAPAPNAETAVSGGRFRIDAASVFTNILIESAIGTFTPNMDSVHGRFYTDNGINFDEYLITYGTTAKATASVAVYPSATGLPVRLSATSIATQGTKTVLTVDSTNYEVYTLTGEYAWVSSNHIVNVKGSEEVAKGYLRKYPGEPLPVPVVQQCTDTDGGTNYFTKGTATYNSVSSSDACNQASLTEYFCKSTPNIGIDSVVYQCPNGCSNGACVQVSALVPDLTITSIQTNPQTVTASSTPNFAATYKIENVGTAKFDGTLRVEISTDEPNTPVITDPPSTQPAHDMRGTNSLVAGAITDRFPAQQGTYFTTPGIHTLRVKIVSTTPAENTANNEKTITITVYEACATLGQYRIPTSCTTAPNNCPTTEYCDGTKWIPMTTP